MNPLSINNTTYHCNFQFSGVLDEDYVKVALDDNYYSNITDDMNNKWKENHDGKTVKQSLSDYLVEYMGKPMNQLLR